MRLPALLLDILFLTPTQPTNNGNTDSPPHHTSTTSPLPPSLLPRQPFTDPNLMSQPITFYETASALVISAGRTYTTTYIDLISATAAFPITPPSTTTTTATTTTPLIISKIPIPALTTSPIANTPVSTPSSGENSISAQRSLDATPSPSPSTDSVSVTPTPPSPSPSTSTSQSSSSSPILNLAPCSTFTASESALEGCISSVISGLSLTGGGPIVASTTTSSSSSTSSTTTTTAAAITVTPTKTVTMPFLGEVVPKGEATFVVGGAEKESRGVRGREVLVGWGVLVVVVGGLVGGG